MKTTPKQYARGLYEIVQGKNEVEAKELVGSFLRILTDKGHISKIGVIINHFEDIWKQESGILAIEICSARSLDTDSVADIKNHIKKVTGAKEIEATETIDKSLLGGVSVRYGDKIWDSSLAARIKDFREAIAG